MKTKNLLEIWNKNRRINKIEQNNKDPAKPHSQNVSIDFSSFIKAKEEKDSTAINGNRSVYEIKQKNKKEKPGKIRTILKLLRYANKKDKIILMLSILAGAGTGFLSPLQIYALLTPVLTVFIQGETPGNPYNVNMTAEIPKFIEFGYGYFIIAAMNLTFGIFQIMGSEIASRNIMAKIKTAYLSKMLSIQNDLYDKSQEQFISTVSHDLQNMMVLFDSKIVTSAEMISVFFFGCIAGFIASWKVALLTLVMMLFAMRVVYFILQASKKKGKSKQKYYRKCTKIVSEVIGNARTVAAYGGEYKEIERYESSLKMANKYGLKHTTAISGGKAYNYFQFCICNLVAYYFSVRLFFLDDFEPGYIAVILTAQVNAVYQSTLMMNTISDLNMATDSAYRVMQFLDTETNYSKSIDQGIVPDEFKTNISFRDVTFSYPVNLNTKVLHDLTLDIEADKVTAVIGTSGAGKSTILGLISRLYDVTAGQILIGGVDIKKLNISWLRNQISVVGQEPILFDTSIEENIRYGKTTATLEEIIEAAKVAYAHEFIEKLPSGYDSIVGEKGVKLSAGQKQRIAIARAIVKKPKLLLLDEATSALDFHSEGIVQESLDNAMRNRTTLIIANRMLTVRNADVIYAIKEGRVVEKGSHSALMKLKGYYFSLTEIQELEEKDKVTIK
ncbi:phosphatidylcholine translocator ABCB4 [Halyomorpha halys]|uniref:phosphatidylcholine translocator ABCB4 n=1 Tax=Halyomorpha halys TaxID=286706 RepID=UPI0034D26198